MPEKQLAQRRNIELSTEIAEDGSQQVHLFPWGEIRPVDGRGPWYFEQDEAAAVLATWQAGSSPLLIDYEHESEIESWETKRQSTKAAGWLESISVTTPEDDAERAGLWGTIKWTSSAAEMIKNREYRFFSPVFFTNDEGRIITVEGGGLTNKPAMTTLLPLAAKEQPKEGTMSDAWKETAQLMGIDAKDEADFRAQLVKLKATADGAAKVAADKDAAEKKLAETQKQLATAAATKQVEAAIASGQLPKEARESWIAQAVSDPEAFAATLASIPAGTIPQNLPPQGKQGRDVAGGEAAKQEAATATEQQSRVVVHGVGPRNQVREGTLELTERVLAETKAKVNTPEFRQEAMAALRRRTAGGA